MMIDNIFQKKKKKDRTIPKICHKILVPQPSKIFLSEGNRRTLTLFDALGELSSFSLTFGWGESDTPAVTLCAPRL